MVIGGMGMELVKQIMAYQPFNEQEEKDQAMIIQELANNPLVFERSSALAHMTASAWVINEQKDKILMAYHNIYQSWSWLGGHADGNQDLLQVAIKEVREESGLTNILPASEELFSLEILTVDGHEKNGVYVPSHLHLNCTFLLQASESEPVTVKPDENSAVAWFSLDEAVSASSEEWFKKRIYTKLNQKIAQLTF